MTEETPELKTCSRCKKPKPLTEFYTVRNKKRKRPYSYCKPCSREVNATRAPEATENTSARAKKWRQSNWARNVFVSARNGAKSRGLEFAIDEAHLEALWLKQGGRCPLSGMALTKTFGSGKVHTNASVDRIDSKLGYTVENTWLVCTIINRMKQELSVADFRSYCAMVASVPTDT